MDNNYIATLELLSDSLHKRDNASINIDNWTDVKKELQSHVVTPLVAYNISKLFIITISN